MVAVEKPVLDGAQLVKKLAESGTGVRALNPARECLKAVHRRHARVATANEVLAALEAAEVSPLTIDKARQFAETGAWVPPAQQRETPIEELLLSGAPVPVGAVDPAPAVKVADEEADEFEARTPAEPVERPAVALKKVPKKPAPAAE